MLESLSHKGPDQRLTLEFRHDVFKYLFRDRGRKSQDKNWTLYAEGDFIKCQLPSKWCCLFDKHGDGTRVKFPVKIMTLLSLSPKSHEKVGGRIVERPRVYIEKISIKFIKVSSSCSQ